MIRVAPDTVSAFYVEPSQGVSNDEIVSRIKHQFRDRKLPAWQPTAVSDTTSSRLGQWTTAILESLVAASESAAHPPVASVDGPAPEQSSGNVEDAAEQESAAEDEGGPITVRSVVEWSEQIQDLTADLNIILGLLTALGIAIAMSSILNTMLMSVTERIVEFGILRANGWSRRDVVRLITSEAAVLGAAGGTLGVICGWAATHVINAVWPDRVHLYAGPGLLVGSLVFAMIVGTLGGFYPAYRAANLSPMEAIRRG
jgi:putative ABC transport system permease protein